MRRGRREKHCQSNFKYLLYLSGGILLIVILTFIITFVIYNNKLKQASYSTLTADKVTSLVPNTEGYLQTEQASLEFGKSIEDAINETTEQNTVDNNTTALVEGNKVEEVITEEIISEEVAAPAQPVVEEKEPEFSMPVDGETLRAFAKENLIYSTTLEEWVTHPGIDIKADRTTVVKASEKGTITSIKNDPRYGLTIVIEHSKNYKTVYSNLLTTEFVVEGENVEKGQSLGTIGNSAAFEISDEPHLHFEILKDNVNLDPSLYLK